MPGPERHLDRDARGFGAGRAADERTRIGELEAHLRDLELEVERTARAFDAGLLVVARHANTLQAGLEPPQRAAVEGIRAATHRLVILSQGLAALGRPAATLPHARSVDLAQLVRLAVADLAAEAADERIDLRAQGLERAMAEGDPERLRRVVLDVLRQAIKFAPHGSFLTGEVSRLGDSVVFRVQCLTPGLGLSNPVVGFSNPGLGHSNPVREIPRPASADLSLDQRLAGLGLLESRRVIRAHGGVLDCAMPRSASGVAIWFKLPAAP